jgi:hypothetical protein
MPTPSLAALLILIVRRRRGRQRRPDFCLSRFEQVSDRARLRDVLILDRLDDVDSCWAGDGLHRGVGAVEDCCDRVELSETGDQKVSLDGREKEGKGKATHVQPTVHRSTPHSP